MSFSTKVLSSVRFSVRQCTFTFAIFSSERMDQFQPKFAQSILGKGNKLFKKEASPLSIGVKKNISNLLALK